MTARKNILQTKFFYVASIFAVSFGVVSFLWRFRIPWLLIPFSIVWVFVVTAFAWELVTRAEKLDGMVRSRTEALEQSNLNLSTLIRDISVFYQISHDINQRLDLPDIAETFAQKMHSGFEHLDSVWLWLDGSLLGRSAVDSEEEQKGGGLLLTARAGNDMGMPLPLAHPDAESPFVSNAYLGRALWVDQKLQGKAEKEQMGWLRGVPVTAYAACPLQLGQVLLGVLGVFSRQKISPEFLTHLQLCVNQLSVAIEKARLLQESENRAKELALANKELKNLDALKDWFISSVSHELRTPLTSIRSFAEILESYQDLSDTEKTEFAGIIKTESERLSHLINDMLDAAKIANGNTQWEVRPLLVGPLAERAYKLFSSRAEQEGVSLQCRMPGSLPHVMGNEDRLLTVLNNLVSNALAFTPKGGSITIRAEATGEGDDGGFVEVSVADNGVGISKEDQERIFDRFTQAKHGLTDKPRGVGLGLAICREIINHLGGRIWVESEEGRGSTFSFTLAAAQPDSPSQAEGGQEP